MDIISVRFKKELGNDTYISGYIALNDEGVPFVEFDSDISSMSLEIMEEYFRCMVEAKGILSIRRI